MKCISSRVLITTLTIFCLFSISMFSCKSRKEAFVATVNNNVCKKLKGKTVLYAVFVDSRYTNPWSEYDISSTLDSIDKARSWIEKQARSKGVNLEITVDYHQDSKKIIPIENNLPRKTLSASLITRRGVVTKGVDRWADKIGKKALQIYGPDTSTITRTKIKPKDRERLIARLRDLHQTDNVALIYFINNYYKDEISVALHTGDDQNPEYAIVSFKSPAVIAHEFLHLFGAIDLYVSPFEKKRKARKRKEFVEKHFNNEIMAFAYRNIDSLKIGPLTEYLISWDNKLSDEHQQMLFGKKFRLVNY